MEPVPMRMYSVSPNHGPQTGGTFVVVKGQAFPHNKRVYCSFQTLVVPAMWINSRTVQCPSPRYTTTSKVSVEVSTDQMTGCWGQCLRMNAAVESASRLALILVQIQGKLS